MSNKLTSHCDHRCGHGGTCVLPLEHNGLHDSRYCQWTDEESIPKEEADLIFMAVSPLPDELNQLLLKLS